MKDNSESITEFVNNIGKEGGLFLNTNYSTANDTVAEFSGKVVFKDNKAGEGGSLVNASYVSGAKTQIVFSGNTTFQNNIASNKGGAILNTDAELLMNGKQDFINNQANNYGGAIHNHNSFNRKDGSKVEIKGLTNFINNQAAYGGAIANGYWDSVKQVVSVGGEANFIENHAQWGGAIYNLDVFQLDGKQLFEKNTATAGGGAIFNFKNNAELNIKGHVDFKQNSAADGGAINNQKGTVRITGETSFENNTATGGGGAIFNLGKDSEFNVTAQLAFKENSAVNGGAIYNGQGTVQISGESSFEKNHTTNVGGAIYNNGNVNFGEGSRTFRENTAGGNGGAIYNARTGVISFGGDNIFESNTANGIANDIFSNGQINFGGEENPHNITVLNGGVAGAGDMVLNSGRLVLGSGAQIHQGSFTAKAGTMTTVVLSGAHHVHDKNVAHFDELTDQNGTGHDKVATAVNNNGFGIHTTGQMTLEKGAVLNIVSDDIQAGHTYLVAYNEKAPEATAAKLARVADASGVINPAGFDHDETSWKGGNLISTDPLVKWERVGGDNTNGYILVTSKDSNSVSIIKDLAGLDQVYFSWLSDLEDLRQRLGEVRLGADNGIWTKVSYARYRASGLGDGKVKSTDYSIHVGADGTLYKNNGHKFFAGFSFKGGHTDMKAARAAGTGDLNHYTWKLYGTYVHEKGSYADFVASVGTFNNRFRGHHDNWTGLVHGDVNNWGAGISGEVGHQFRLLEESAGSFWFAEPQIQLSYFRVKGKNYETSNAIHVEQKSVNFLTGRVGVSAGKQFAYGADKKRYLQLSAKAGLIREFAGDQKLRLNEKKLSADGKKNLFYYGADMDWQFADNHKLYLKVDRATGSGYRKDIQIQGGYRYSF